MVTNQNCVSGITAGWRIVPHGECFSEAMFCRAMEDGSNFSCRVSWSSVQGSV